MTCTNNVWINCVFYPVMLFLKCKRAACHLSEIEEEAGVLASLGEVYINLLALIKSEDIK